MNRKVQPIALVLAVVSIAAVGGCPSSLPVPELPATLAAVAQNAADFQPPTASPLIGVVPGTVVDDLANLDGCWATIVPDLEQIGFTITVALKFDVAAGTYTQWGATENINATTRIVAIERGTYTVVEDGLLRLTTTELLGANSLTGDLEPVALIEDPTFEVHVSIDGDELLYYFGGGTPAAFQSSDDATYLYQRLDCVE